jgi:hypothetical protein
MRRCVAAVILAPLFLACSSPPLGPLDPGTSNQVDVAFNDQEPNNTPDEATPLGISSMPDVTVWVGENAIGGPANPADYFVFESSSSPGTFEFNMCYTPAITGLTASLWKVIDAKQQTPPVATWTLSTNCDTSESAPLDANTAYLFGVLATGGAGFYTA